MEGTSNTSPQSSDPKAMKQKPNYDPPYEEDDEVEYAKAVAIMDMEVSSESDSDDCKPSSRIPEPEPEPNQINIYDRTDDELINMTFHQFRPTVTKNMSTLRKYLKQVDDSEGFDIEDYPGFIPFLTNFIPKVCSEEEDQDSYKLYVEMAEMSLAKHNEKHQTSYVVEKVHKVTFRSCGMYHDYYLTFNAQDASSPANVVIFQAIVSLFVRKNKKSVELIRPKISNI